MAGLSPGSIVGDRFELVGVLGQGGTATVYLAHDRSTEQRVALKVLHPHLVSDPSMRRRLQREVDTAALIDHPAALVATELVDLDGLLMLTMPYHPGTPLTDRVRAHGPLSSDDVRALGVRLASVLDQAHRSGVLHRDVTPNNVLLDPSIDSAVLADFGLARSIERHTGTATVAMGTPGYAPPEVYEGHRADTRSDLYGLGALLYFAATGESPFGGGAPASTLRRQLANDLAPVLEKRPSIDPDLAQTIELLLSPRPDGRPGSASDVVVALQARVSPVVAAVPATWEAPAPVSEPVAHAPAETRPPEPRHPEGAWVVVAKRTRRSEADALSTALEQRYGTTVSARALREKQFRLCPATDEATARELGHLAELHGYAVQRIDTRPLNPVERMASFLGVLIPIVWVAFPFVTVPMLGGELAIFLSVALTILVPFLMKTFGRPELPEDLALAAGQLTVGEPSRQAEPPVQVAEPPREVPTSATERLGQHARRTLAALTHALDTDTELPALLVSDLRGTVADLEAQIELLVRTGRTTEQALADLPAGDDAAWLSQRLQRLETQARDSGTSSSAEHEAITAALEAAQQSEDRRDALHTRLTQVEAQLLALSSAGQRAHAELALAGGTEARSPAVERLAAQTKAAEGARRELALQARRART